MSQLAVTELSDRSQERAGTHVSFSPGPRGNRDKNKSGNNDPESALSKANPQRTIITVSAWTQPSRSAKWVMTPQLHKLASVTTWAVDETIHFVKK